MRPVTLTLLGLVLFTFLGPATTRANTISQNFSVAISPAANLAQHNNFFVTTPIALFNPSNGTLSGISITFGGPATWTSSDQSPTMVLSLGFPDPSPFSITISPVFTTPGPLSVNLSTSFTNPAFLSFFAGTGMAAFDFIVGIDDPNVGFNGTFVADSFLAPVLNGSITYDYAVPEPSSLLLLVTGLLGLLGMGLYKKRLA